MYQLIRQHGAIAPRIFEITFLDPAHARTSSLSVD
jgi:hypothetical protein